MEITHLTPIKVNNDILFVDLWNKKIYYATTSEIEIDEKYKKEIFDSFAIPPMSEIPLEKINKKELLRKIKDV